MLSYEEYLKNPSILLKWPIPLFKEHEHEILPARSIGATVTNFKNIDQIKLESRQKIKSFFKKESRDDYM
jgi:hypothetical protein